MADILTNIGEEWVIENNLNGSTVKVGLYNNSTDALGETSTLGSITTEPSGASYARQSSTVTTLQISGDFGFDNDSKYTFDTSDSSQTVDHGFSVVNFQSDTVAGDGSATDHLIGVGALSQSRDLSQIDTLEIAAGDFDFTVN
ncbi:MAG: hypothetical protein ABEJ72_05760 [Candidatus Aenigmatarchaeota archaeon]